MGSVGRSKETDGYHSFPYWSRGTHEYMGDHGETESWFRDNSNFDELVSGMSRDELDYFEYWTRGWFMGGDQYEGFSNMSEEKQKWTRAYDKILDQAVLDKPLVVHRLATAELLLGKDHIRASEDDIKSMLGKEIVQKANMSTGAAAVGLSIGSRKQIDYEIRLPAGKGIGMWVGDSRFNGWGSAQREFMMNRDVVLVPVAYKKFEETALSRLRPGIEKPQYTVILEWRDRVEHDYS